jgi:hypothetical protein
MFLGADRKNSSRLFDFKGLMPNSVAKNDLEEEDGRFLDQVAHIMAASGRAPTWEASLEARLARPLS